MKVVPPTTVCDKTDYTTFPKLLALPLSRVSHVDVPQDLVDSQHWAVPGGPGLQTDIKNMKQDKCTLLVDI